MQALDIKEKLIKDNDNYLRELDGYYAKLVDPDTSYELARQLSHKCEANQALIRIYKNLLKKESLTKEEVDEAMLQYLKQMLDEALGKRGR